MPPLLRRILLALASALLVTLSHALAFGSFTLLAHGGNGVIAFVALIPWYLAIREADWREGYVLTFITTLGYFIGTIHWVFVAMNTFGGLNVATSVFGLVALSLALAFFVSLTGAVVGIARTSLSVSPVLVAPFAWAGFEFLRTWVFSGFPWSNLAYTQWGVLPIAQIADLGGLHLINILIVAVNAVAGEWIYQRWYKPDGAPGRDLRVSVPLIPATAVVGGAVVLAVAYGLVRMPMVEKKPGTSTVTVGLTQGNIPQDEKWDRAFETRILQTYNDLSRQAIDAGADLVVWPEGALPRPLHKRTKSMGMSQLWDDYSATMVIGAAAYFHENGETLLHNSAFVVKPGRHILDRYDKSHLVPFGEYVPIPLPGFAEKVVEGVGDYVPGEVRTVPLDENRRLGVLICYEDIFPEISRQMANEGAQLLVNITNDAWYGRSSAPYQHMGMIAMRAIETRLPVVRSANTGISGVISPSGRILDATPIFEKDVVVATVPLRPAASLYLVLGDTFGWLCLLGSALLALWAALAPRLGRKSKP